MMTVKELRAQLFDIKDQDAEVLLVTTDSRGFAATVPITRVVNPRDSQGILSSVLLAP